MNNDLMKIAGFNMVYKDGLYYVGDTYNNAMCTIDEETGYTKVLHYLSDVSCLKVNCYSKVAINKNKVLFVPLYGEFLYLYDVETMEMHSLSFKLGRFDAFDDMRFWEILTCGSCFYVIGHRYPGIIRVDADTLKITYINDFIKEFENDNNWKCEENRFFFGDGIVEKVDKWYIPTGLDATLMCFNRGLSQYGLLKTPSKIKKILSISCEEDNIWMTDLDDSTGLIGIFNICDSSYREFKLASNGLWYAPVFCGKYAYFLPMSYKAKCYRVDMETFKPEVFERFDVLFEKCSSLNIKEHKRISDVLSFRQIGSRIVFVRRPDLTWFSYDFETDELTSAVYTIEDDEYLKAVEKEEYDQIFENLFENNSIVGEKEFPLKEFLSRV